MKPWQAVSLDVGGTLIEPWPSVGHVYAGVVREFGGPEFEPGRLTNAFLQAWSARRGFDYSRAAWRELVETTFAEVEGSRFRVSDECFAAVYERFGRAPAWRVFEDVGPLMTELRARGIPVVVVSNWDERLRPLMAELGLAAAMTDRVISHEVGMRKPDAGMFLHAGERLGVAPGAVLHVGDSEREDVEGARRAGLQARWLLRTGGGGGDWLGAGVIRSLFDLLQG